MPASQAKDMRLVDEEMPEEELLPRALKLAGDLSGKSADHVTLGALKLGRYQDVLEVCNTRQPFRLPGRAGKPAAKM